jgi:hypothetical protein
VERLLEVAEEALCDGKILWMQRNGKKEQSQQRSQTRGI